MFSTKQKPYLKHTSPFL